MGAKRCNWIPIVSLCSLGSFAGSAPQQTQLTHAGRGDWPLCAEASALGSLDGLHKTPDAIALDEPLPEPSQIMRVDRDYSRSWRAELLAASAT